MFDSNDYHYGFKKLNSNTFLQPEEFFMGIPPVAFLTLIMEPELNESIPEQVRALFEVARGAIAYGYFFYPLFSLGIEQLSRVAETAAFIKSQQEGAPVGVSNFSRCIDWLKSKKMIVGHDAERWRAINELRNISSHPESQKIFPLPTAVSFLQTTSKLINELFEETIPTA